MTINPHYLSLQSGNIPISAQIKRQTGSHSLRSNSTSQGANHLEQMFRNVQLDL